jgi:hypothetical protein
MGQSRTAISYSGKLRHRQARTKSQLIATLNGRTFKQVRAKFIDTELRSTSLEFSTLPVLSMHSLFSHYLTLKQSNFCVVLSHPCFPYSTVRTSEKYITLPVLIFSFGGVKIWRHRGIAFWAFDVPSITMVTVSIATVAQGVLTWQLHRSRLKLLVTERALANFPEHKKNAFKGLQIKTYFYNEKKPPTLTCMNKKSFMF